MNLDKSEANVGRSFLIQSYIHSLVINKLSNELIDAGMNFQ